MSILIKGMKMPKNCDICPFMKTNDDLSVEDYRYMYCDFPGIGEFVTDYEATRHPDCPLIELPPHGDLIDRDALMKLLNNSMFPSDMVTTRAVSMAVNWLRESPTILEAEEGE